MSSSSHNFRTCGLLTLVLVLAAATALRAQERQYFLGTSASVVTGGVTSKGVGNSNSDGSFYYEMSPSVHLSSTTKRTAFQLSYAFGLNRNRSLTALDSNSHVAAATYSSSLGQRWKLVVSESFVLSSNLAGFNAGRGVTSTVDSFRFLFNSSAAQRSSQNTVQVKTDYSLSNKSTLSMVGSHSLLQYANDTGFRGVLSNQQRSSGTIAYAKQTSEHAAWTLAYTGAYFSFANFPSSTSHTINAGYLYQLMNDLTFRAIAGPSYTETPQTGRRYSSYNASVSLQKIVKANTFSLYYAQAAGDASGLGSISDTRSTGLSVSRPIGKGMNVFADVSAFDTESKFGNSLSTRGVSGAGSLGMALTKALSLNWGAQYQRYDQASPFGFEQKRLFLSLRFNEPQLWTTSR